jgi:RNA polymerase-binding transcription factor DksA
VDIPDATAHPPAPDELDLDAVERDLLGVEVALQRLDAGTYRNDELDGRPIPDEVLERDPIARRAP